MSQEVKGCLDQESYDTSLTGAGNASKGQVTTIGTEANPTICKLVSDPRWGKAAFYPVRYHKHSTSPIPNDKSEKSRRRHQCISNYGLDCPECQAFWDAVNEGKNLIKTGSTDDSPAVKIQKQIQALYKNENRFWILIIQPGRETVTAVQIGYKLKCELFGAFDNNNKETKAGLIKKMKAAGRNPFDLKSTKGWLKLWKTGEALETVYHCEEHGTITLVKNAEGDEVEQKTFFSMPVDPAIFKLQLSDIPEVLKLDGKAAVWTKEEVMAYVNSAGGERPERVIYNPESPRAEANADNSGSENRNPDFLNNDYSPKASETSMEDDSSQELSIPFAPSTPPKLENKEKAVKQTAKPQKQQAPDPLDDLV